MSAGSSSSPSSRSSLQIAELPALLVLSRRFSTRAAVLAEVSHLRGVLALPKGTVHVVSDVHGEHKKLSHIVRNASGRLRPIVDALFASSSDDERRDILSLAYYPRETWRHRGLDRADAATRQAALLLRVPQLITLARHLARSFSMRGLERVFPPGYVGLFRELFAQNAGLLERDAAHLPALLSPFVERGDDLELLVRLARVVRNLAVKELVVAGDLGDRGPRIDRTIDVLMKQPEASIAWGNHDVSWMGACLGQEALIATVVRISLRYRRLAQLEEGYGIPMAPVERLARDVYGDDAADRFGVKGKGLRDPWLMERMQKAMAIVQFKLEGQAALRNPDFGLGDRALLQHIDREAGTVRLGDRVLPLLDTRLPTLDPKDPYRLSEDEARCMARLKNSFLSSPTLWRQMEFVRARGAMAQVRDHHVIFHGCIPIDDEGKALSFAVEPGHPVAGKALFDAFEHVVHRAFQKRAPRDLDLLWYLWTGPLSPLFGKDKMATFEGYFVDDKDAKHETKNPYFKRIHDRAFCEEVLRWFGADPALGLIVNGHVPVKLEKGEDPVKQSGLAVTIDGAFSEAYGDRGYTLILEPGRTALAEHHHFESVEDAVESGADIVPRVTEVRAHKKPRTVDDTEAGVAIRAEIDALLALLAAYEDNRVREQP